MLDFESLFIQKIGKNFKKITKDLQTETKRKDFKMYSDIKNWYSNGVNIGNKEEFQKTYKMFYVMRFVTKEYITKYFDLLNTKKIETDNILTNFLKETDGILNYKKNNAMQFSFATKALHTINNNLPIYDRFISKFFQLEAVPNDINLDVKCRIEKRQRIYNELVKRFNSFLSKKEIQKYIKKIRSTLGNTDSIGDAKMLDFIILSCESEIKKNSKYEN